MNLKRAKGKMMLRPLQYLRNMLRKGHTLFAELNDRHGLLATFLFLKRRSFYDAAKAKDGL